MTEYYPIRRLGNGVFGDVWLCEDVTTSNLIAIKQIRLNNNTAKTFHQLNTNNMKPKNNDKDNILLSIDGHNEVLILGALSSCNYIPKLLHCCISEKGITLNQPCLLIATGSK